jgi:hypothetical protein
VVEQKLPGREHRPGEILELREASGCIRCHGAKTLQDRVALVALGGRLKAAM